jgi:hypothetical protein
MSIRIQTEVWKYAPVSGNALVLLLRLADSAGEQHRMTWESIDTLAMNTRMGRATVFRSLSKLTAMNIIEEVPEAEQPPEARHYNSVVRRIRPVTDWKQALTDADPSQNETPAKGDNSVVATSDPSQNETRLKMRPNTSTNNNPHTDTTYLYSERPTGRSNYRRNRQQAEAELAAEADRDPAKIVGLDETTNEVRPRSHSASQRRNPGQDTGIGLALYWSRESSRVVQWRGKGDITNHQALAGAFKRWIDSGMDPDKIRAMIDAYTAVPGYWTEGKAPWIDFLAKRFMLIKSVEKAESDLQRSDGDSPEYWKKKPGDADGDDISRYQKR